MWGKWLYVWLDVQVGKWLYDRMCRCGGNSIYNRMYRCGGNVWLDVQVWGNGCICFLLLQHEVTLRIGVEEC